MPVYNAERYVVQAVESILQQTDNSFEFLILDDGSNDQSLKILNNYAAIDSRIRLYPREHTGLTRLLNEGLQLARGKYLCALDADDLSRLDRFQMQRSYLDTNESCVAVGAQSLLVDSDGDPIAFYRVPHEHNEIDSRHMSGLPGGIVHPLMMARLDALHSIGGYRETYEPAEDYDLLLRLAEVGRLANLPELLFDYRLHAKQTCEMRLREQWSRHPDGPRQRPARAAIYDPDIEHSPSSPISSETKSWARKPPHLDWARMALNAGFVSTARKHGWLAVRQRPISLQSHKILLLSLISRRANLNPQ